MIEKKKEKYSQDRQIYVYRIYEEQSEIERGRRKKMKDDG
jgi:hypothetical protein